MPGTIDVQAASDPNLAGAHIFIDGQAKGTVPQSVEVPKGRHLLEIKKDEFNDYAQWVDVPEGQRETRAGPQDQRQGVAAGRRRRAWRHGQRLTARSCRRPPRSSSRHLDEGAHVVEVSKAPAVPWKQTVYVKSGQRSKVTAELQASVLQAEGGNVRVIVNVEDAAVWVDGVNKGKGRSTSPACRSGMHIVEARAEGYDPKEERVTVNAGRRPS